MFSINADFHHRSVTEGKLMSSDNCYEQNFAWMIFPSQSTQSTFGAISSRQTGFSFSASRSYFKSDYFCFSPMKSYRYFLDLNSVGNGKFALNLHKEPVNIANIDEGETATSVHVSISVIHKKTFFDFSGDITSETFHFDYDERYDLIVICRLRSPKDSNEESRINSLSMHTVISDEMPKHILSLFQNEKFFDVSFAVEGKEFKAHWDILAARSPVFAAMLEHDTLERRDNRINIPDFSSEVISQLLYYIYGGEIELSEATASCLYRAADKYAIPELRKQCSNFLCTKLTVDNILSILALAHQMHDESLEENAANFFAENAAAVMLQQEWLPFMKNSPELANTVLIRAVTNTKK